MYRLTDKQAAIIHACQHYRLNAMVGGQGSGKTFLAALVLIAWCRENPRADFMLAAPRLGSIKTNVIPAVREWCESLGYQYSETLGGAAPNLQIDGTTVWLYGGGTQGRERAIRGANLAGAVVDEATLIDETFMREIIGRVRIDPARILLTTNPAGPMHWLKRNWLDVEAQGWHYHLLNPTDNPHLSQVVVQSWQTTRTGADYQRMVLGQWVAEEGLVYPDWHTITAPPAGHCIVGLDWGQAVPTAAVYLSPDGHVVAEYYVQDEHVQPAEHAARIVAMAPAPIEIAYADPSADVMVHAMRDVGVQTVDADNSVELGIQTARKRLASGETKIDADACPRLVRELQSYVWDTKAADKGEDKPLKRDDHACDALRYALQSHPWGFSLSPDDFMVL